METPRFSLQFALWVTVSDADLTRQQRTDRGRKREIKEHRNDSGSQNSTTPSQYATIVGAIHGEGDTVSDEVTRSNDLAP